MTRTGRPTKYSKKVAEEICTRIASGETVLQMCRNSDHLPAERVVYTWLLQDDKKDFLQNYEKARAIQAERMAEELIDIADDGQNDFMEREGKEVVSLENIQRSRLRVDTRKWISSRLLPKKYGDKLDLTSKGGKLPQPILGYVSSNDGSTEDTEAE